MLQYVLLFTTTSDGYRPIVLSLTCDYMILYKTVSRSQGLIKDNNFLSKQI